MMKVNSMIRTKCQNMLRWSGQNANQKLGRTKCQPEKKARSKCCLVGILSGWHFVLPPPGWFVHYLAQFGNVKKQPDKGTKYGQVVVKP